MSIGVVDLSDLTTARKPLPKTEGAHPSATDEGDPYHGYDSAELAPELMRRICEACGARLGAAGMARGRHLSRANANGAGPHGHGAGGGQRAAPSSAPPMTMNPCLPRSAAAASSV